MTVAKDGSAQVLEHLEVDFDGEYHGIYRDIPIEYPGPHGSNYTLFLNVTGVTDGHGHKLKYDSSTRNGYRHLKIYIPDAVNATRIVDIRYTMSNAVRWFDDHDELYWNVPATTGQYPSITPNRVCAARERVVVRDRVSAHVVWREGGPRPGPQVNTRASPGHPFAQARPSSVAQTSEPTGSGPSITCPSGARITRDMTALACNRSAPHQRGSRGNGPCVEAWRRPTRRRPGR